MSIQRITSKWKKTGALFKNDSFSEYIPQTELFHEQQLAAMLDQYTMVYMKPNNGTFGKGVIRIEKLPGTSDHFQFQSGTSIKLSGSFQELLSELKKFTRRRTYLIQQGIELLTHNGRRFDLRVMVQQNPRKEWETTGIIGRLAHPHKVVTNYHSGGTPLSFELLMSDYIDVEDQAEYLSRLQKLGIDTAFQFQSVYPRIKELGVDVAIDRDLKPWILEVNTLPDPFLFRKLEDKRIFRKIYRYAVAYGRFKKKRAFTGRRKRTSSSKNR